jgi:hypothetical protein
MLKLPKLYLSLNQIEGHEIPVSVRLLSVVQNETIRMLTQEPDLNVKGLPNVFQSW